MCLVVMYSRKLFYCTQSCGLSRGTFHEVVEHGCGDGGEVPVSRVLEACLHCRLRLARKWSRFMLVSRVLEACLHCRFNSVDPVPLRQFEDRGGNLYIPVLVCPAADR